MRLSARTVHSCTFPSLCTLNCALFSTSAHESNLPCSTEESQIFLEETIWVRRETILHSVLSRPRPPNDEGRRSVRFPSSKVDPPLIAISPNAHFPTLRRVWRHGWLTPTLSEDDLMVGNSRPYPRWAVELASTKRLVSGWKPARGRVLLLLEQGQLASGPVLYGAAKHCASQSFHRPLKQRLFVTEDTKVLRNSLNYFVGSES